jgi:hypothetical protein
MEFYMVDSSKNSNYFIFYLIEDAVQVWHFAHLIRKHSAQIISDQTKFTSAEHGSITLLEFLNKRVDLVCKHHIKTQTERETLQEMMEDLTLGNSVVREPLTVAKPLVREAIKRKMQSQEDKPERGIALIRTLHGKVLELEKRVSILEGRGSAPESDAPLTTN